MKKIGIYMFAIFFLCILYFSYKIYFVNTPLPQTLETPTQTGSQDAPVQEIQQNEKVVSTGSTGGDNLNFKYTSTGEVGGGNTY